MNFLLPPYTDITIRHDRIRKAMTEKGLDGVLISSKANIYYATGAIICGYVYIPLVGQSVWIEQRAAGLPADYITISARKPELIGEALGAIGLSLPKTLGLELGCLDYLMAQRLMKAFPMCETADASALLRGVRAVKTDFEVEQTRLSGIRHERVYRHIPGLFHEGMSDIQLQIEIERSLRLEGCLGVMRTAGDTMEIFMSNVLVGRNADTPSPYDFAMGGAGLHPSLPGGADGSLIRPGNTVMVDANGNFTGYMTDMTRVFSLGEISETAKKAHQCSIAICRELERIGVPGTPASALYEAAVAIATEWGLERYFMGHKQKAGFVGHGVGVELNELPVLAPRSRDVLAENNVIAIEPKFVIPDTGAVGIENTYFVTPEGLRSLTNAPEEIIPLV